MNTVCIIIGIIFFICVLVGWGQGFFKQVVSVVGLLLSLIIAFYVAPHLSRYLEKNTQIDENIAKYIAKELKFSDSDKEESRGVQVAVINELPLPERLKANILDNNNSEMYNALEVSGVYGYISKSIAVVILNAGAFLFLLLACRLFFCFFIKGLGEFTKLPIIRSIDKIGGGLLGGIKGIILLWIFFMLLSITSTALWSQGVIAQISDSTFLKLLYDNNLLLDVVGDLTRVLFF